MKIGLFVHKIHQFEPDTGKNTQDRCVTETNFILNVHNGYLVLFKCIQGDMRCTFWFLPCQHWNANLCHTFYKYINSQTPCEQIISSLLRALSACYMLRVRIIITRAS